MAQEIKFGWFLVFAVVVSGMGQEIPSPVPIRQVQPEWPPELSQLYIEEPGRIEMVVDADGVPYSLSSSGIDDNIVTALSQWRYHPMKKDGRNVAFSIVVHLPLRVAIDPDIERTFWRFGPGFASTGLNKELADAIASSSHLDETAATQLETALAASPADINARASLLSYYAHSASNTDAARAARLTQIEWLATNAPSSVLWTRPFTHINVLGGPLEDPAGYARVREIWMQQLTRTPQDAIIDVNAARFLKIGDPEKALQLRSLAVIRNAEAPYSLAEIYGLAAVGVAGIDPTLGTPVSVAPPSDFGKKARAFLMQTNDPSLLLAGLATITLAGKSLSKAGHLPADYQELCEGLLTRAKQVHPAITTSCDPTVAAAKPGFPSGPPQRIRVGGNVQAASLIKRVQPVYPAEAKSRHIQGTVRFNVIIDKQGEIAHMTLASGPLPLYRAARDAVRRWVYKPTKLDGRPVEVLTAIDVNFVLSR